MIVIPEERPIVFVDDDEIDRMVLAAVFERSSLRNEAVFLESGTAAIDHFEAVAAGREQVPGIAFLDVNMPGLNGFEVLTYVRAKDEFSDLPIVVMLTSSDAVEDVLRADALGAAGFIPKKSGIADFVALFDSTFTNDTDTDADPELDIAV